MVRVWFERDIAAVVVNCALSWIKLSIYAMETTNRTIFWSFSDFFEESDVHCLMIEFIWSNFVLLGHLRSYYYFSSNLCEILLKSLNWCSAFQFLLFFLFLNFFSNLHIKPLLNLSKNGFDVRFDSSNGFDKNLMKGLELPFSSFFIKLRIWWRIGDTLIDKWIFLMN